jgi:hypothetical protein
LFVVHRRRKNAATARLAVPVVAAIVTALAVPSWAGDVTPILKKAPQEGDLLPGQRVLVDDGSCPRGQIKEIIGGGNRSHLSTRDRVGSKRRVKCIKA